MQSRCPHCDNPVEVPDRQIDVMCPHCHRYFLWTPGADDMVEPVDNSTTAGKNSEHVDHIFRNNTTLHEDTGNTENSDLPDDDGKDSNSIGLYRNSTIGYVSDTEPNHHSQRSFIKKNKNLYPYELPGQVVEADRRMPVYSSMMSDAYTILQHNFGAMVVAIFFYMVFMAISVISCIVLYWILREMASTFSKGPTITVNLAIVTLLFLLSTCEFTWIMNGQRQYVIGLIRSGKATTSYLFSGFCSFFRNLLILWIHLVPLFLPAIVGYCYYLWNVYQGDIQKIEESLGILYYAVQQTPVPIAIAAAIMGIGIFLIVVLDWGLAFWLTLDKNLTWFEAITVSHKITREKKATFLKILCSSNGVVIFFSIITLGMAIVLFPIALLFVGMYYMKTAIQEMVIPGKTELGAHVNLYGNEGKLSSRKKDEEEDIL